jgi:hypothetical protein
MFCLNMLSLSLVHSVIHTLLLALSASGRSVNGLEFIQHFADTEFQYSVSIPDDWIVAQQALYPVVPVGALKEAPPLPVTCAYLTIIVGEFYQYALDDCFITSTQAYKSIWQIDTLRNRDFLGAPAKDMLVRQNIGDNLTKIRKIFTVRKSHAAADVFVLSFSAPPNDYELYKARVDALLRASFVSLS